MFRNKKESWLWGFFILKFSGIVFFFFTVTTNKSQVFYDFFLKVFYNYFYKPVSQCVYVTTYYSINTGYRCKVILGISYKVVTALQSKRSGSSNDAKFKFGFEI